MKQAIHIFKKDIRALRLEICLTLLVVVAIVIANIREINAGLYLLWAVIAGFLIVRVIQSETLVGDRQFWCTRPYDWRSLLGAKLLFLFAFVNLPIIFADIIILWVYGFSPLSTFPGLVWSQVLLITCLELPSVALSTITTGITQVISALIVISLPYFAINNGLFDMRGQDFDPFSWVKWYLALAISTTAVIAVISWQYRRRKTTKSRLLTVAAYVAVVATVLLIPWQATFAVQSKLSNPSLNAGGIQVAFDSSKRWLSRARSNAKGVEVQLPLSIITPSKLNYRANGLIITIETPDGEVWRSSDPPWYQINLEGGIPSLQTTIDPAFYRKIKDVPVKIHGSLFLTILREASESDIPVQAPPVEVAGAGLCSVTRRDFGPTPIESSLHINEYRLTCNSAFRTSPDSVSIFVEHSQDIMRAPVSFAPFPAELNAGPIIQSFAIGHSVSNLASLRISTGKPVAFVQKDFELTGIRFSDFDPDSDKRKAGR